MSEWRDLHVGDVLGLLESPQEEVVEEVRQLLKETLQTVRDPWLVTGLLDYFFATNSARILDLLLGVREPHDRHLLDRVYDGLKGNDRFRYSCLLLYAVRRQPPPMWLRKLSQHGAMKELLHILHTEDDLSVLVSGLMVVVVLMPLLPLEMGHFLNPILEVFSRLVKWAPRPDDSQVVLIPYLQVAVYSLFHRIYAFWPCHFMPFLHDNFSSHDSQGVFITTLKPMLERVRLHPLLVTGTPHSELSRSRWIGLEPHQLIHECAKLCLDPIEATCEDGGGSWFNIVNVTNTSGSFEISSNDKDIVTMPNSWMLNAVENSFWSPSLAKSPPAPQLNSRSNTSVPNTPVYPILTPTQPSVRQVAESPPEAAIEATPETTPFTSPVKLESTTTSRRSGAIRALSLNIDLNTTQKDSNSNQSPMSPKKKEQAPFKFPDSQGRDIFSQVSKSHLLTSKLQQIQKDRQQSHKENLHLTLLEKGDMDNKGKDEIDKESKDSKDSTRKALGERPHNTIERSNSLQEVPTQEKFIKGIPLGGQTATDMRSRRRKVSVFDGSHLFSNDPPDLSAANINGTKEASIVPSSKSTSQENGSKTINDGYESPQVIDRRISEEKESDASVNGDSRRSSSNRSECDERRSSDDHQGQAEGTNRRSSSEASKEEELEQDEDLGGEGLGIPSQRSMSDLVKNMRSMRLRYFSQCGPPPDLSHISTPRTSAAISPTKMVSTPVQLKKRSSSCPDLASVESDPSSMTSSLISRRVRKESTLSSLTLSPTRQAILLSEATTQTEETDVVNPYELLLEALSLGPGILKTNNNSMQNNQTYDQTDSKGSTSSKSPHELLDQYVTYSAETKGSGELGWSQHNTSTGNTHTNAEKVLKKQVGLMHTMLMIERYKREVHAERNRRLLGRAKKVYALEEHQKGLKEEVQHLEEEVIRLRHDLKTLQSSSKVREHSLQLVATNQQEKINKMYSDLETAKQERALLVQECGTLKMGNKDLTSQFQQAQGELLERNRQLSVQARMAQDNNFLRKQVESLHKQVTLMGELNEHYKQQQWQSLVGEGSSGSGIGERLEHKAAHQQISQLQEAMRSMSGNHEAALARIASLEEEVCLKEKLMESQQQLVKAARESGAEQCRAAERRSQNLIAINQSLESRILENQDRIDRLVRQVRRTQRGKSVCSDGYEPELELSASPSSASSAATSTATSPPDELVAAYPSGILGRQPLVLNKLDSLVEMAEAEAEGSTSRRKPHHTREN